MRCRQRSRSLAAIFAVFFAGPSLCFATAPIATPLPTAAVTGESLVDGISAVVSDGIITESDIGEFRVALQKGGLIDENIVPDEATRQELIKEPKRQLDKLIEARLLDSEAEKQKLKPTSDKVEQEIQRMAGRARLTRKQFVTAIEDRGEKFSEFQDFVATGMSRASVIEKNVVSKVRISEDDVISQFLARGKDVQAQALEYTLAHIFFSDKRLERGGPKSRAEGALAQLKGGAGFDRVAADTSEDPGFEAGGLLGEFRSGEMPRDLEAALRPLEPGQTTGVLPTRGGYHIVRVVKRRLVSDPRIEKEKERLRAEIGNRAFRKQFTLYMDQLRSEAFIRIN